MVSPFILAEEDKEQLKKALGLCWVWKETSGTALALWRQKEEGLGFEASLVYMVSTNPILS